MIYNKAQKNKSMYSSSSRIILHFQNKTISNSNFTGWYISVPGKISIVRYREQNYTAELGKYFFRVTPNYTLNSAVSMYQNISLENFTLLISVGMARYSASVYFRCLGNQFSYMQLTLFDLNDLSYSPIYQRKMSERFLDEFLLFSIYFLT